MSPKHSANWQPYSASPSPAAPAAPTAAREGAAGERGGAAGFSDASPAEHAAAHRAARILAAAERYREAWARDVDAELARCYRAAAAHYRALSGADADAMAACAGEIILAEARIDMDDAHAALMRGYP